MTISLSSDQDFRAGDEITVELTGDPGHTATFDIGSIATGSLNEDPLDPGHYTNAYTVVDGDDGVHPVIGRLTDSASNSRTEEAAGSPVTIIPTFPVEVGCNTVYFDDDAGKWSSLVIDSDGNPHIAFLVSTAGQHRIKYTAWDSDAGSWAPATGIGEVVYEYPVSLAIGSDGIPRISYLSTENHLKYAVWDAADDTWELSVVSTLASPPQSITR